MRMNANSSRVEHTQPNNTQVLPREDQSKERARSIQLKFWEISV